MTYEDTDKVKVVLGVATRRRMDKMEEQLASLTAWVHTAVIKGGGADGSRPGSARSNSSISESSYSTKSSKCRRLVSQRAPTPPRAVSVED